MGAWGSPLHIFYRLNVIPVLIPLRPLRERIEDILPPLTKHFLESHTQSGTRSRRQHSGVEGRNKTKKAA